MENADPLLLLVSLPLVPLGLVLGKMVSQCLYALIESRATNLSKTLHQVKWQEPVLHFLRAHLPHLKITRLVNLSCFMLSDSHAHISYTEDAQT